MKLRQNNLIDLYRRLINFISSNYPDVLVVEKEKNTIITYSDGLGRIAISQDKEETTLLVSLSLDVADVINPKKTKTFFVSTIDELNCVKSGIQVCLEMTKNISSGNNDYIAQTANEGQGYLLDANEKLIGVVDLSAISTNAFIRNAAIKKNIEMNINPSENQEKTIRKFFKR